MEGLMTTWSGLDFRRRFIVIAATLGVFAAVVALARSASERELALLYAGLDRGSMTSVISALDQRGVVYEVRGDSIFVPAAVRDLQRISLAAEGLPQLSGQGYELLDNLSGFGTTSQMFDAAYWRAKEGELARTILAVPTIRAARVHISTPTSRPFQRDLLTTASVTVTTAGNPLSQEQAQALRFLIAAAVSGLMPQDVSVIDAQHGLIPAEGPTFSGGSDARADELRARAQRLLEARVGVGNAIVELSIETITERESIIERRVDPESRVAISTNVEENSRSTQDGRDGSVTVASNLPDGDAGASGSGLATEESGSRALTNYDMSETSREVIRAPGGVRRLTVAVLVNEPVTIDASGTAVPAPRPEEEIAALRELVASAVGFDEARGDVITIQAMPFEPVPQLGTEAVGSRLPAFDMMSLIKLGVLALVALVLGLFVIRPILRSGRTAEAAPLLSPGTQLSLPGGAEPGLAGDQFFNQLPDLFPGDPGGTDADEDPVGRLRRMIADRQEETAQILQNWIDETEPREGA